MNNTAIVVDASCRGEITFARAEDHRHLGGVRSYDTVGLTTFTDALLRYQNDEGLDLRQCDGVIAISGPVVRGAIPIARSRWTISRSGLAALFGRPPILINEVAARAWATRQAMPAVTILRGTGTPVAAPDTRMILLTIDEGVGDAVIDVDADGQTRILSCEMGHADFAPADQMELSLATALRGSATNASWEQVLLAERTQANAQGIGEVEWSRRMGTILGRFTCAAILANAAWDGVMLTGQGVERLLSGTGLAGFNAAFESDRALRRHVVNAPCWRIEQSRSVLTGGAALLADRRGAHRPVN